MASEGAKSAMVASSVGFDFLGMYAPDGVYVSFDSRARRSGFESLMPPSSRSGLTRNADVPKSVKLHSMEKVIEDFQPPARATAPLTKYSFWGNLRDNIITFAYGKQKVLASPVHIAVDSRNRVILADPEMTAIHVLDGKNSFRIVGGSQHWLRQPNGVAVDAKDNIYVADGKRGVILVYSPEGVYQRSIGQFQGESMFERPTGIAIDREKGLLYVVDTPVHELVVLDLTGHVVKRIGNDRESAEKRPFDLPSEVAVSNGKVFVLDSAVSRIQVFDSELRETASFKVRNIVGMPMVREVGLAADDSGNIYLTSLTSSTIRVFNLKGEQTAIFGSPGIRQSEFNTPEGICLGRDNKVYVADTKNSRVQIFAMHPSENRHTPASAIIASSY